VDTAAIGAGRGGTQASSGRTAAAQDRRFSVRSRIRTPATHAEKRGRCFKRALAQRNVMQHSRVPRMRSHAPTHDATQPQHQQAPGTPGPAPTTRLEELPLLGGERGARSGGHLPDDFLVALRQSLAFTTCAASSQPSEHAGSGLARIDARRFMEMSHLTGVIGGVLSRLCQMQQRAQIWASAAQATKIQHIANSPQVQSSHKRRQILLDTHRLRLCATLGTVAAYCAQHPHHLHVPMLHSTRLAKPAQRRRSESQLWPQHTRQ
jgi:hypothetical protein